MLTENKDTKQFKLMKKDNVWILFFKRKPKRESNVFHIGIAAKPNKDPHSQSFKLHVKLSIVP